MRVRVIPCQAHSLAFGGFDVQMLSAISASREEGVDISPLDLWSRDSNYDILQLWGLEECHLQNLIWAKRSGKRVVLTALLPYISLTTYFKSIASNLIGRRSYKNFIASNINHLIVVNEKQAISAVKMFGVPKHKISIIPNIIEDKYLKTRNRSSADDNIDLKEYILCTGNICRRKNQLKLAQAAISESIPLLFIGHPLPGEESHINEFQTTISEASNIKWIPGLHSHSDELYNAYKNCLGFALLSSHETQPISALEAAALGKPLMLSDKSWAKQVYYENACLINSESLESIKSGIRKIVQQPEKFTVPRNNLISCSSEKVGQAYRSIYEKLKK